MKRFNRFLFSLVILSATLLPQMTVQSMPQAGSSLPAANPGLSQVKRQTLAPADAVASAMSYLMATQSMNGSWISTNPRLALRDTATAIAALRALTPTLPLLANALAWLANQDIGSTDYLARRILALNGLGYSVIADRDALLSRITEIGTWAGSATGGPGGGDAFDTSLALAALAASGDISHQHSLATLVSQQHPDGGWSVANVPTSTVQGSAAALLALGSYRNLLNLQSSIANAIAFLQTHRHGDSGFGDSASSDARDTALAILALRAADPSANATTILGAQNWLKSAQLGNGSWGNDVFVTALALQALVATPTPGNGSVRGRAIDEMNRPVVGASVTVAGAGISQTMDASGVFTLTAVPAGAQLFQFASGSPNTPSYVSASMGGSVPAGGTLNLGDVALLVARPVVSFTWTPTQVVEGGGQNQYLSTVTFVNQTMLVSGTSIINVQWDASDGTSLNSQPPSYINNTWGNKVFADAGDYTVTLHVQDSRGLWSGLSQVVHVANLAPAVVPGPPVTTVVNAPLHFYNQFDFPYDRYTYAYDRGGTDNSQLFLKLRWNFGDGAGSYRMGDTEYLYSQPGVYSATLSATDREGATGSGVRVVNVISNTPPFVSMITAPLTTTAYSTVAFSSDASDPDEQYCPTWPYCSGIHGAGIQLWRWDFGDGTAPVFRNPSHFYYDSGVYTVTLVVTDVAGASASVSRPITVINQPPVIAIDNPMTVQVGSLVNFYRVISSATPANAAGLVGLWNFGDGVTSTLLAPTHTWAAPGSYSMIVSAVDPQGASTAVTATVYVTSTTLPILRMREYTNVAGGISDVYHGSGEQLTACYGYSDPNFCTDVYGYNTRRYYLDGVVVSDQSPADAYGYYFFPGTEPIGLHSVTLEAISVTNGITVSARQTRLIRVLPAPIAAATNGTDGGIYARGLAATTPFYGYTDNGLWLIDWGDGWATMAANYSPHVYPFTGTYTRTFYNLSTDGLVNPPSLNVIRVVEPQVPTATLTVSAPCRVQLDNCTLTGKYYDTLSTVADGSQLAWLLYDAGQGTKALQATANYCCSSIQAQYPDSGNYTATLLVMTSAGMTATTTLPITVADVPPVVTLPITRVAFINEPTTIFGSARSYSPAANRSLKLGLDFGDGTPPVAPLSTSDGNIVTQHVYTSAGIFTATLVASDKAGAMVTGTSRIMVLNSRRPIIASTPPSIAVASQPYYYSVRATDPLNSPLSYFLSQRPQGMRVDAGGNITWTPGLLQTGFVQVTLVVSNNLGATTLQVFPITVLSQAFSADLVPERVSAAGLTSDPQSLHASGSVSVVVTNYGLISTTHPYTVTFFDDTNEDGTWSPGVDTVLASATMNAPLAPRRSVTLSANAGASASVLFRDNIVFAYVDSVDIDASAIAQKHNLASSAAGARFIPPVGLFAPTLKLAWTGSTVRRRCCYISGDTMGAVLGSPVVAPLIDTNGDGKIDENDVPAIIFTSFVNSVPYGSGAGGLVIRAIRGDNGQAIFDAIDDVNQIVVPACSFYACYAQLTPVVGDLDGDGKRAVVYVASDDGNYVYARALNSDGTLKWTSTLIPTKAGHRYDGLPAIADLDGDGKSEIIFGDIVWNHDGTLRWARTGTGKFAGEGKVWSGGLAGVYDVCCHSIVADLNMDGHPKIIAGNRAYSADGTIYWDVGMTPTLAGDGFTAVAEFNPNDPYPDVVLVSHVNQHAYGAGPWFGFDSQVRLLAHDGRLIWGPITVTAPSWATVAGAPGGGGPPVIADLNGDGVPDIGLAGFFAYTAISGKDGSILWQVPTHDHSSGITGSAAFDFDGTGKYAIVYNDELYLRILRGSDGATLWQTPNPNSTWLEEPAVADVDGSGHVSIVVGRNQYKGDESAIESPGKAGGFDVGVFDQGIFVYGDALNYWRPGRKVWNQSAYHVTNVNDNGTIPPHEMNSWQTPGGANTYRAQITPPGIDPFAAPDLTASRLVIDNSTCPASASITIRVGNGGSLQVLPGVKVAFRDGGSLAGVISTTHTLLPGYYQDLTFRWGLPPSGARTISVTVDDDGTGKGVIPESREDNNTHTRSVNVCSGSNQPPVINSTPPLTAIVGTLYSYAVQASDPNGNPLSFALASAPTGAVINSNGAVLWKPSVSQLGQQPLTIVVDDGNGGIARQAFTVTVIAQQPLPGPVQICTIPGAPGIPGNGIGQDCIPATPGVVNPGAVTPTISTDQRSYTSHQLARLISVVQYAGSVDTYAGLTATVTVRNGSNVMVFSSAHALSPLAPGGRVDLADTYDTDSQPAGTFTAQIVVTFGAAQIASSSTQFAVGDAAAAGVALSGTLGVTPAVINIGRPFTVTWSATNAGNSALSSVALRLLAVDPGNGSVIASDQLTVPLAMGSTFNRVSPLGGVAHSGPVLLVLLGTTQGISETLASGGVLVTVPSGFQYRAYLPVVKLVGK